MRTLFALLAFGIGSPGFASTLYELDERALHAVNALGKCPGEFQTAVLENGSVIKGEFVAPRPADPNVYRETHTLTFANGKTLRLTATTRRGTATTYECAIE